jgi:murein DD-endopeptidase MepM/ murein hydrolase activator NlpD
MAVQVPLSESRWSQRLQRVTSFKRQHGAWVAAGVAVAAMSLSAIAVAVAPMLPNPADLPQRQLVESVATLDLAEQLESQAAQTQLFHKTLVLRGPEGVASVVKRAGLIDAKAVALLARHEPLTRALQQRGARLAEVVSTQDGQVHSLVLRSASSDESLRELVFQRLTVSVDASTGVRSRLETQALQRTPRLAGGTVQSSLFAATDDAALPDAVAQQLANIFSADIDFHRELRRGDSFSLVYEALTADGQAVPWDQGSGRVLAAEFRNAGRVFQAHWFQAPGEANGQYYDAQGRSRKRAFLASPMEFSRVTSGFAMRLHPILREWRAHRGVDYAAPIGTPVRTVGDGVVSFAGWQQGYGKTIEIRHSQDRSTLYAHLSRIDVNVGQRVSQGATVGAVGNTGMSTGPHLHFEFRVAGVHQDPSIIARQAEQKSLSASALTSFGTLSKERGRLLSTAATLVLEPGTERFE